MSAYGAGDHHAFLGLQRAEGNLDWKRRTVYREGNQLHSACHGFYRRRAEVLIPGRLQPEPPVGHQSSMFLELIFSREQLKST